MSSRNIHDAFAREALSFKDNAECFFRGILPEDALANLNFKSLKEEKTSYTDGKLSSYFSDVVYECSYKGSVLKLALLFEHKSFVPVFPHSQLLQYILNIWDRAAKANRPIPIVLPIVLYHGKRKWEKRPLHTFLGGDTDMLARFIPDFEYLLVDLSKVSDKEIIKLFDSNPAVKLWLLIQKYIYAEEMIIKVLDSFFKPDMVYFKMEEGLKFVETICRYIFEATKIEPDIIVKKIPMLPDQAREVIMTTAERLRKQGIKQGEQIGEVKGKKLARIEYARRMVEKGYPAADICDITGLSLEELKTLQLQK